MGERHIAARDAAEARRVEEERRREAAAAREREEQEGPERERVSGESVAEVPVGESSQNDLAADGDGGGGEEGMREREGEERQEALVGI